VNKQQQQKNKRQQQGKKKNPILKGIKDVAALFQNYRIRTCT
jgi:hypothetical protein